MTVQGQNRLHGTRYEPVKSLTFVETLEQLRIPYNEFVFVDCGSGKGRTILLASNFPFKGIIGVDYCADLVAIARRNVTLYPENAKKCKNIELLCMDAADFSIPNVPMVLFFNNPFGPMVFERVINNLERSFAQNRRQIIVIYFNSKYSLLWNRIRFLKRRCRRPAIYETRTEFLKGNGTVSQM
jgi:predicted RNA methylase